MAPGRPKNDRRHQDVPLRRLKAVGLASPAVLLVVAMTVAFTNASGARSIAINSGYLHWANVSSGVAAVTRGSLNQAAIFAVDEQLGVTSSDATEEAIAEAQQSLTALNEMSRRVPTELRSIGLALRGLVESGSAFTMALEAGDVATAMDILDGSFEPAYFDVAMSLGSAQTEFASRIETAESVAARVETSMQWLATLLIPGLAVVLYRSIVRRRYRRSEVEFDARLKAERRINVAKDEFIAAISHELRTPLTSIVGFSDHLLDGGIDDRDEAVELLRLINHDSEELARMVEDLLTAARVEGEALAFDYSDVDLLGEVTPIVDRAARQGISIKVVGTGPHVWGDPARVRQIIRNLVSNAIRHGGTDIAIRIEPGDGTVALHVVDDGPGVPDAIVNRLFQPFVHESKKTLLTGSVGLGLAIVRSLATAMGGDVGYRRRDGYTTFSFSLELDSEQVSISTTTASGHPARGPSLEVEIT